VVFVMIAIYFILSTFLWLWDEFLYKKCRAIYSYRAVCEI